MELRIHRVRINRSRPVLSYRRAFLESTEKSASEDLNALKKAPPQIMPLWILSGKGAVQIMLFRKLGGKFHFFLRFCTRKRSKTYSFKCYALKTSIVLFYLLPGVLLNPTLVTQVLFLPQFDILGAFKCDVFKNSIVLFCLCVH